MKKLTALLILVGYAQLALSMHSAILLDKIIFQISAKHWVKTQTAILTVNINATLNNSDVVEARNNITTMLKKIAPADWYLTQFDRSQDSSGLDTLYVVAKARVAQEALTNVYQQAKSISKPGATYSINSIEFTPSLEEIQQVKQQLRAYLSQQVTQEISRLNKIYTNQNYSVNSLIFFDGEIPPLQAKTFATRQTMMVTAPAAAPNLTVSNELKMGALVELASNRSNNSTAPVAPGT